VDTAEPVSKVFGLNGRPRRSVNGSRIGRSALGIANWSKCPTAVLRGNGRDGSRSVGLARVDSSETVIDRLTAPRLFRRAAGGALLNAMWRGRRRFCRHDVLIRFPFRQSLSPAWLPQPKIPGHLVGDDRSSTVCQTRPGDADREQEWSAIKSQIVRPIFSNDSHATRQLPTKV
jgi:hypothetical protein